MSRIAYVNGCYVPHAEACVGIEDRGYQFGDGVYEVVPILEARLVDEGLHLDRFDRSLRELALTPPMARRSLRHILREVARRNRIRHGLVYVQVTRGVARRDHAFPQPAVPSALVVTARRGPGYPAAPEGWATAAITVADQRWARCDIKSINLLPNVLAKQAAREAGASEAILVDDGIVTEGSSTSVWVVDEAGRLRLPPLDRAILPGCTRAALSDLLAQDGLAAEIRAVTVGELAQAREVFLTSATSFVKPVVAIDGHPVGDGTVGPVTRRLFDLLARHAQGGPRNEP